MQRIVPLGVHLNGYNVWLELDDRASGRDQAAAQDAKELFLRLARDCAREDYPDLLASFAKVREELKQAQADLRRLAMDSVRTVTLGERMHIRTEALAEGQLFGVRQAAQVLRDNVYASNYALADQLEELCLGKKPAAGLEPMKKIGAVLE